MNKLVNLMFVLVISLWAIGMLVIGFTANATWYYGELNSNTAGLLVMFWCSVCTIAALLFGRWITKTNAEKTFQRFGRPILD